MNLILELMLIREYICHKIKSQFFYDIIPFPIVKNNKLYYKLVNSMLNNH